MFILNINSTEAAPAAPVETPPENTQPIETAPAATTDPGSQPSPEQVQWLLNDWKRLNDEVYATRLELETTKRVSQVSQPGASVQPTEDTPQFLTTKNLNDILDQRDRKSQEMQQKMNDYVNWEQQEIQKVNSYIDTFKNLYETDPNKQKIIKNEAVRVAIGLIRDHNWTVKDAVERALLGAASDKYQPGGSITNTMPGRPEISTQANAPTNGNTNKLAAIQELEQMEREHKVPLEIYLKKWVEVHGDPATTKK